MNKLKDKVLAAIGANKFYMMESGQTVAEYLYTNFFCEEAEADGICSAEEAKAYVYEYYDNDVMYAATILVDGEEKTIAIITKTKGVPDDVFEAFISTLRDDKNS